MDYQKLHDIEREQDSLLDHIKRNIRILGNSDDKSIAALLVKLLMEKEKGSGHVHGR